MSQGAIPKLNPKSLTLRMLVCIKCDEVAELRTLLEMVRKNYSGRPDLELCLCEAAKRGNVEIVRLLLRSKASVTNSHTDGKRPIHYAAESASIEVVRAVLTAGSPVNVVDATGATALHIALEMGYTNVALYLLHEGATVNRPRTYVCGLSPLHMAAKYGRLEAIKIMLSKGADLNALTKDSGFTPLHLSVQNRYSDLVHFLSIQKRINVNIQDGRGKSPLHLSVENMTVDNVGSLLDNGADPTKPDYNGRTPLHYAAATAPHSETSIRVASLLIEKLTHGVDHRDTEGCTPLHFAALSGNQEIAALLLLNGADIDAMQDLSGDTPLSSAISNRNAEMAQYLIIKGACVNIPDQSAVTPLHKAQSLRGTAKYVLTDCLIRHGAKINAISQSGYTPLDRCVFLSAINNFDVDIRVLQRLVAAGVHLAPVTVTSHSGVLPRPRHHNSPLCWLTWHGEIEAARFLVDCGWDLNHENWVYLPGKSEATNKFMETLRDLLRNPHSLRQTCRSVIRRHMNRIADDTDLIPLVDRLPMPTPLKRYLKLENEMSQVLKG